MGAPKRDLEVPLMVRSDEVHLECVVVPKGRLSHLKNEVSDGVLPRFQMRPRSDRLESGAKRPSGCPTWWGVGIVTPQQVEQPDGRLFTIKCACSFFHTRDRPGGQSYSDLIVQVTIVCTVLTLLWLDSRP